MKLTDDGLAEWRAHPVSEYVRDALGRSLNKQMEACKEAAWAGPAWSEARRLSLHRAFVILDEMFNPESTAEDFNEIMEIHEDE
jgi:uncharacterized protein with von Willebrand factor type A (vWA) domain